VRLLDLRVPNPAYRRAAVEQRCHLSRSLLLMSMRVGLILFLAITISLDERASKYNTRRLIRKMNCRYRHDSARLSPHDLFSAADAFNP
jgi:hypothetical protein